MSSAPFHQSKSVSCSTLPLHRTASPNRTFSVFRHDLPLRTCRGYGRVAPATPSGIVTALEKEQGSKYVSQFRPICVLAFLPRLVQHSGPSGVAPLGYLFALDLWGGVPGKGATNVWWNLQTEIERSLLHQKASGRSLPGPCEGLQQPAQGSYFRPCIVGRAPAASHYRI